MNQPPQQPPQPPPPQPPPAQGPPPPGPHVWGPPPPRKEWKAWQIVLLVLGIIVGLGVLGVVTFVGLVWAACSGKC